MKSQRNHWRMPHPKSPHLLDLPLFDNSFFLRFLDRIAHVNNFYHTLIKIKFAQRIFFNILFYLFLFLLKSSVFIISRISYRGDSVANKKAYQFRIQKWPVGSCRLSYDQLQWISSNHFFIGALRKQFNSSYSSGGPLDPETSRCLRPSQNNFVWISKGI